MHSAPLPDNEAHRLAELRFLRILDTPFEERFDRITRTATMLFHVPIALVSLVDDTRQWFKSCQGLDIRETSREISFCSHAILTDGPFIIEDARKDLRFADNPLVTGKPHIVFYAGHPLVGPGGQKLGTLCLIDRQPHLLSQDELTALGDLAAWVELELGATRMESLISCLDDAMLIFDNQGILKAANPAAEAVFLRSRKELLGQQIETCIPDYNQAAREQFGLEMMNRAYTQCAGKRFEYSGQRPDSSSFPLEISVSMATWDGRQVFISIVHDLTARKDAEKTLQETLIQLEHQFRKTEQAHSKINAILDASKEAMLLLAPDGSVLEVNHRFEQFFSVIAAEIEGMPFSHFLPLAQQIFVAPQAFEALLAATWGNDHRRFKETISQAWPKKRELEIFSTPVSAGEGNFLGRLYVFRDVTKERQIDRMKSEFVSLVSHELRTPITSIMGYISLVQDGDAGPLNDEQ
jgi:PAS domain S-box-containing protein